MATNDDKPAAQRREHVRVSTHLQVVVRMPGQPPEYTRLADLSGTGCGFYSRLQIEQGLRGKLRIEFGEWVLECPFVAKSVRSARSRGWYVGAQFESITRSEVDRVVREVFAEQRRKLKGRAA